MDWNWFFSSLAQCGAALIGIIAAFIISRLLNENADMNMHKLQNRDYHFKRVKLINQLQNIDIRKYNENRILESPEFWNALDNDLFDDSVDSNDKAYYCLSKIYKICSIPHNFNFVKSVVENRDAVLEHDDYVRRPSFDSNLNSYLDDTFNHIEALRKECYETTSLYSLLLKDIQAKLTSFKQIKFVLIILMLGVFITVVYPLSFLPMDKVAEVHLSFSIKDIEYNLISTRGFLLTILTVIIESIFIYFLFHIKDLKSAYNNIKHNITEDHLNPSSYCSYFTDYPTIYTK
jgi:hypothetical protein